jgi:RNA recognition motif-containing protein
MGTRIFVGNLSFDTSEQDLLDLFARDNRPVEKVSIVTDRDSGRSRGFAFVEMGAAADAAAVIAAINGTELHGRQLNVSQARERVDRPRRPGGFGGSR